jgi:hypothetical protein
MIATNLVRSFDAKIDDVNQEDRTIVARVSTSGIDRYNSIIVTKGIRLDSFRRSPIVLHEHGKDPRVNGDPIGTCLWIRTNGGPEPTELIAKIRFVDTEFAIQRYQWYRDHIMNGFSIRCLPDMERCSPATREEIKANPALGRGRYIEWGGGEGVFLYRSGELLECSTTSIPGNSNCVSVPEFAERAATIIDLFDAGKLWLPDEAASVYRSALLTRTTTESMGGLAGGGATVPPASGKKVKPCDDEPCDEDDSKCDDDDEKKRSAPDADKPAECEGKEDVDRAKPTHGVKEIDGKFHVVANDGKPMGTYDSREEADKRVQEIEYFKHEGRSAPEPEPEPQPEPTPEPKPIQRGLHVVPDDHGMFDVFDGAEFLARYDDQAIAERAVARLGQSRTFGDIHEAMVREVNAHRAIGDDLNEFARNEIKLQLEGIV